MSPALRQAFERLDAALDRLETQLAERIEAERALAAAEALAEADEERRLLAGRVDRVIARLEAVAGE